MIGHTFALLALAAAGGGLDAPFLPRPGSFGPRCRLGTRAWNDAALLARQRERRKRRRKAQRAACKR